jgi:hypothetical protein
LWYSVYDRIVLIRGRVQRNEAVAIRHFKETRPGIQQARITKTLQARALRSASPSSRRHRWARYETQSRARLKAQRRRKCELVCNSPPSADTA